jgi:hypothetical protein
VAAEDAFALAVTNTTAIMAQQGEKTACPKYAMKAKM